MRLFRRKTSSSDYEVVGDPQLTGLRFESSSSHHHQSETQFNVPNNNNDDAISIATAPTPVPPLIMDSPRSLKKISSGKHLLFWIFAPIFCLTGLGVCWCWGWRNRLMNCQAIYLPPQWGIGFAKSALGCMKRTRQITLACLRDWIDERMPDIKVTK